MSHILDALKKLEHEKSRKSRSGGMINISGALFEQERPRPPARSGLKICLAVAVAVLVTFGITWFVFKPGGVQRKPVTPGVPIPPQPTSPPPAIPAMPAVPPPTPAPVPSPAPAPAVTPAAVKPAPARPAGETPSKPAENRGSAGAQPAHPKPARAVQERQHHSPAADQMMPAPAEIKLSGVAWQEERGSRRAVINGQLMREGTVVAGAVVTDILPDRVRFSQAGKFFEIPLISSPLAPAGK